MTKHVVHILRTYYIRTNHIADFIILEWLLPYSLNSKGQ